MLSGPSDAGWASLLTMPVSQLWPPGLEGRKRVGKRRMSKLCRQDQILFLDTSRRAWGIETGSYTVTQASLEPLAILPSQPSEF